MKPLALASLFALSGCSGAWHATDGLPWWGPSVDRFAAIGQPLDVPTGLQHVPQGWFGNSDPVEDAIRSLDCVGSIMPGPCAKASEASRSVKDGK